MARVCVIGGGVAGRAAAEGAAQSGSKVVMYTSSTEFQAPKSSWPELLLGKGPGLDASDRFFESEGVEVHFGEEAVSLTRDCTVVTREGRASFDTAVVATGSYPEFGPLQTGNRLGSHRLAEQSDYSLLARELPAYSRVAVMGRGLFSLEVADRIARAGPTVSVFSDDTVLEERLSMAVSERIVQGAQGAECHVELQRPRKVVGVGRVEAVVSGDAVFPCDAMVVVPVQVPRLPAIDVSLGRTGGIVVDDTLRSSSRSVFAAGDCTESKVGGSSLRTEGDFAARAMGHVAGLNAAGGSESIRLTRFRLCSVFGVEVAIAGVNSREAAACGLDVVETTLDAGPLTCSIVSDSRTGRVLGIQLAGSGLGNPESLPVIIATGATLDDLSHSDFGPSTDISAISETARRGAKRLAR